VEIRHHCIHQSLYRAVAGCPGKIAVHALFVSALLNSRTLFVPLIVTKDTSKTLLLQAGFKNCGEGKTGPPCNRAMLNDVEKARRAW
jgi:hypothetical protein